MVSLAFSMCFSGAQAATVDNSVKSSCAAAEVRNVLSQTNFSDLKVQNVLKIAHPSSEKPSNYRFLAVSPEGKTFHGEMFLTEVPLHKFDVQQGKSVISGENCYVNGENIYAGTSIFALYDDSGSAVQKFYGNSSLRPMPSGYTR